MNQSEMTAKIEQGDGFIAALDQSGGSTPKALKGYGIEEGAWSSDEEMFDLIHQMRSRIITSPCFGSGKVIGAILFERTMDGTVDGKPTPQALIDQGVVPFIKIDKGLEDEENGVQMMKPMPELDALARAGQGRSACSAPRSGRSSTPPTAAGIAVARRAAVPGRAAGARARPDADHRARGEHQERRPRRRATICCSTAILEELDELPEGQQVMLKLSIPAEPGLFEPLVDHPKVLRVVALSGGFSPRGSLPRAGEEPRHDRQLQPRACCPTSAPSRATRSSTARSARRSTRSTRRRPTKVPA